MFCLSQNSFVNVAYVHREICLLDHLPTTSRYPTMKIRAFWGADIAVEFCHPKSVEFLDLLEG